MARLDTTKELDFLLHETGKDSAFLLAQAVQEGVHLLFKRQVTEAYPQQTITTMTMTPIWVNITKSPCFQSPRGRINRSNTRRCSAIQPSCC